MSGGVFSSCIVTFDKPGKGIIEVCMRDRQENPLGGAELIFGEGSYLVTDPLGCAFYQGNSNEKLEFTVWKNGYLPLRSFSSLRREEVTKEELVLEPMDQALMWHKVVVIDPRGREDSSLSDSSPEKVSAEVNLRTALCLRKMLELAGAKAFLTREDDTVPTHIERVIKANMVRADLLISLDHRRGSSYLGYYFNSSKGKLLAHSIKQVIDNELSCKKLRVIKSNEFILVHTGMPAVEINLDRRKCKKLPRNVEERSWVEAQALYRGLRSYFKLNHRANEKSRKKKEE